MNDPYYINFQDFSLARLQDNFQSGEVLPARQILKQDLGRRFQILSSLGLHSLDDLISALKTKQKVEKFSRQSGLPLEYLVILRREVRSYIPKPVYLGEIPGVDGNAIEKLASVGIKHSKHFFERGQSNKMREKLALDTGISKKILLELAKLSDLARVRGIGATYTRLCYETGADTLEKMAGWDPEDLRQAALQVNQEQGITKVVPPLKDFKQYVELAGDLPKQMEFE